VDVSAEEQPLELVPYGVFYCHDGNFSVDTSYEQVNKILSRMMDELRCSTF
jgi:hypothetical protein